MANITVQRVRRVPVVSVKSTGGVLVQAPGTPITLTGVATTTIERITDIPDVVGEDAAVDGATLVYDAENEVFEVKLMDIDGGSF